MFSIDHLVIAVKSLAAAKNIYETLGLSVSPEETVEAEQVRLVMVPVGESRLELLEPTSDNSPIAKFISKRGEGLHHVSLRVSNKAGYTSEDGGRFTYFSCYASSRRRHFGQAWQHRAGALATAIHKSSRLGADRGY